VHGRIDGLVNNAAILVDRSTTLLQLSEDELRRVMDVNLVGPLRLCQLVVPGMVKRGYGRIVNISSGLGAITDMDGGYASYRITKLALNGLTRILSAEIGRDSNVKVNSLCPRSIRTGERDRGPHFNFGERS
jgi:NAD(P)-dependent dehydrogenase (short-subunit alcohol dehydrogenase family)